MRPSPVFMAAAVGLLAAVFTVSTNHPAHSAAPRPGEYRTSGDVRTETRPVTADFRTVALTTSADVVVRQGSPASITVSGPDEAVTRTETAIEKGQLVIRTKGDSRRGNWTTGPGMGSVRVTVVLPHIEALAVSSSGDMKVEGSLAADELAVQVTGSGDLHVPSLEVKGQVSTTVVGSGDIHLAGKCQRHSVRLTGSGDVKARDLRAESAIVKVTGSGDVSLYAAESLDASVSGSGDVAYAGSPKQLVKNIRGSGSVVRL